MTPEERIAILETRLEGLEKAMATRLSTLETLLATKIEHLARTNEIKSGTLEKTVNRRWLNTLACLVFAFGGVAAALAAENIWFIPLGAKAAVDAKITGKVAEDIVKAHKRALEVLADAD